MFTLLEDAVQHSRCVLHLVQSRRLQEKRQRAAVSANTRPVLTGLPPFPFFSLLWPL